MCIYIYACKEAAYSSTGCPWQSMNHVRKRWENHSRIIWCIPSKGDPDDQYIYCSMSSFSAPLTNSSSVSATYWQHIAYYSFNSYNSFFNIAPLDMMMYVQLIFKISMEKLCATVFIDYSFQSLMRHDKWSNWLTLFYFIRPWNEKIS